MLALFLTIYYLAPHYKHFDKHKHRDRADRTCFEIIFCCYFAEIFLLVLLVSGEMCFLMLSKVVFSCFTWLHSWCVASFKLSVLSYGRLHVLYIYVYIGVFTIDTYVCLYGFFCIY